MAYIYSSKHINEVNMDVNNSKILVVELKLVSTGRNGYAYVTHIEDRCGNMND
jgi:hypothetical protein